jgi:crossover junction endodeoxyribonuclease RuvC
LSKRERWKPNADFSIHPLKEQHTVAVRDVRVIGSRLILGIDPGLNGGLALLSSIMLEEAIDIPTHGEGTKRRVDAAALLRFIQAWSPDAAFIERAQSMPGQGVASTFNYGRAVGTLEAVITCARVPLTIVEPSKWKKHFGLPGGAKNKENSRQRAIQLFPDRSHFFVRKMDHQRAEAALIALYGSKL